MSDLTMFTAILEQQERVAREIAALEQRRADLARELNDARAAGMTIAPTPGHREAVRIAAARIREHATDPRPRHGHLTEETIAGGWGQVDPAAGWMLLSVGLDLVAAGVRFDDGLWQFTAGEAAELVALVEAEGITVRNHWVHSGGLSIDGATAAEVQT